MSKSEHPKVAFLILCWNNKDLIDDCLAAIHKQTYRNKSIYIIDNNSSDGSVEYIRKHYPDVNLIASNKNNGFARGNNILVKEALKDPDVKYVALVNTDAFIDPNWTQTLVDFASDHPKAAGLQGLTIDYRDHSLLDSHHIFMRFDLQSVQYGFGAPNQEEFYYSTKVFGVNAAAALYSRAFLDEQPGQKMFEEKFFMYLEDVDVSFRAILSGWENYFVAGTRAYHMGSASAKKRSSEYSLYMTFRNQAALCFRNLPWGVFIKSLRPFVRMELLFYKNIGKAQGAKALRAVLRGRIVGLLRLPLYLIDRRRIQRKREVSNEYILTLMRDEGLIS